jgi:hypothetical protein
MRLRLNMSVCVRVCSFWRKADGAAALELALTSPFLILGLVGMMDLGLALGARMELDRNVRAGVQAVVSQIVDPIVVKSYVLSARSNGDDIDVTVGKRCTCGSATASCTGWCTGGAAPSVFIDIKAKKAHHGILLPDFNLDSETHVQIR